MKHILVHGLANRGGGSETFLINLVKYLDQSKKFQIHLFIAKSREEFYTEYKCNNTTIYLVDEGFITSPIKRIYYENIVMKNYIKEISPDLIFIASEIVPVLWNNIKIPIIINYHSTLQMSSSTRLKTLKEYYDLVFRKRSLRIASRIVCVSNLSKAEMLFKYGKQSSKFVVIYHGVNHTRGISIDMKYPFILSVGDRHEHKCYELMIEIYKRCRDNYGIEEHLVIIGRKKTDWYDLKLSRKIEELGLSDYVHFIEYLRADEIVNYYKTSSLYLVTSNWESFGLTPLEAMAQGVPTLIRRSSALAEIYNNVSEFIEPDFENLDRMAEKCVLLLRNANKRRQLIDQGMSFSSSLSWKESIMKYETLFVNTMQERR